VPGRQAPAIDARNGCYHSVGRGHRSALAKRYAHDVAVGECRGFGEGEDPVGKRWRQEAKPRSKRAALWSGRISPIPKAISAIVAVGNASSASFRTSQAITAGFDVLRIVSEMTLVA
jgi:hypothetical protein